MRYEGLWDPNKYIAPLNKAGVSLWVFEAFAGKTARWTAYAFNEAGELIRADL